RSFEKGITLAIIDDDWKEHLRELDELRQSVQNAVFEQKDPLLVYKFESFKLFEQMLGRINREVLSMLFKGHIEGEQQQPVQTARPAMPRKEDRQVKASRSDIYGTDEPQSRPDGNGQPQVAQQRKLEPVRVGEKIGRNDPCPCGSGKKYKNCH